MIKVWYSSKMKWSLQSYCLTLFYQPWFCCPFSRHVTLSSLLTVLFCVCVWPYQTGPPQYRSRTVYENATPEMVREFFWDDEFRSKWDDMLISARTLAECPTTGTMVVHWVRKVRQLFSFLFLLVNAIFPPFIFGGDAVLMCFFLFSLVVQFPFFCSDREYIIGRRIWEAGRSYYCITKV